MNKTAVSLHVTSSTVDPKSLFAVALREGPLGFEGGRVGQFPGK